MVARWSQRRTDDNMPDDQMHKLTAVEPLPKSKGKQPANRQMTSDPDRMDYSHQSKPSVGRESGLHPEIDKEEQRNPGYKLRQGLSGDPSTYTDSYGRPITDTTFTDYSKKENRQKIHDNLREFERTGKSQYTYETSPYVIRRDEFKKGDIISLYDEGTKYKPWYAPKSRTVTYDEYHKLGHKKFWYTPKKIGEAKTEDKVKKQAKALSKAVR